MSFELPRLPYAQDALEPYISARTLEYHYGKHHQTYVTNLNNLIKDSTLAGKTLEEIILESSKDESLVAVFNNAAQVWNHTFFWNSMKRGGGGVPVGRVAERIEEDFGGLDVFFDQFKQAGTSQFGSGWVWLAQDSNGLKIVKTPNAVTPLAMGLKPLVTCDVWEHAYYLDYQNRRADFIQVFLDHLINWDFVEQNMG